ncbi:unnamed protein product, partial [Staurois parvus]
IRSFGSTAGTASSGEAVAPSQQARQWAPGHQALDRLARQRAYGSPGMTAGSESIGTIAGTGSGTGSSGSTAGIESTGLIGSSGWISSSCWLEASG